MEPSAESEYKATILSSSFTLPVIRFNADRDYEKRKGTVSAFNSLGAGIALNFGRLTYTTDATRKPILSEFKNTVGFQAGILFSTNSAENQQNVFAGTFGLNILNFQFGIGYEFGDLSVNQKPLFFTIAYNLPLTTLVKSAYHVLGRSNAPVDLTRTPSSSAGFTN